MDKIFSAFNEVLPLLTVGGVALSAAGLIPRIGPGRALSIALRSRFASKPKHECLRFDEIKLLKREIADKDFGQSYLVVIGEKGVGKTCLLNTVTSKTPGVIEVIAMPSDNEDDIIKNTLQELVNPLFTFMNTQSSAPRVVFWYRLLTLGRSPIVVIRVAEKRVGREYACLTGAVRTLVEDYKLRVVVDGRPDTIEGRLMRTHRQRVFDIKPMTKEMIWQIEQLQDLFKYTKEVGMDDTVFAVLGGIPSHYEKLWRSVWIGQQYGRDAREIIGSHLRAEIFDAIKVVRDSKMKENDKEEIIKLFGEEKARIQSDTLTDKKLERPSFDKIIWEVKKDRSSVLIPATNAVGIVLQHSLTEEPTLDELEELLKNKV